MCANIYTYIPEACKKASEHVGIITGLRKLIPTEAKSRICKAAILPYLTYCSFMWHFCKSSLGRKIEQINEHELRTVYCDRTSPYSNF